MSLETSYKTAIVIPKTQLVSSAANIKEGIRPDSPCLEILRKAMELVVKKRGGVFDTAYSDNEGKRKECFLAVRTGDFPRGVGIQVEPDGRLMFLYDAYGDRRGVGRDICDEITQNYAVIAVMLAQSKHGFRVEVAEVPVGKSKKRVLVKGVM